MRHGLEVRMLVEELLQDAIFVVSQPGVLWRRRCYVRRRRLLLLLRLLRLLLLLGELLLSLRRWRRRRRAVVGCGCGCGGWLRRLLLRRLLLPSTCRISGEEQYICEVY